MVRHKYALFYPEHTGYLHIRQPGNDRSADLIWSIREKKPYMRWKVPPENQYSIEKEGIRDIKGYKDVVGVPRLIHAQSFQHLNRHHPQSEIFRSASLICEYCNGGNLSRFQYALEYYKGPDSVDSEGGTALDAAMSQLPTNEALEIFIWHVFDSVLEIFDNLHNRGRRHEKGYNFNLFFHFKDRAKLPEIRLGNVHLIQPGSDEGNWSVPPYAVESDKDSKYNDTKRQKRMEELRTTVAKHAKRARANVKAIPDLSGLRRDQPAIEPTLYSSREELLKASLEDERGRRQAVSGPWRIAHVDPKTFKILAVEKIPFNLHEPTTNPCSGDYFRSELREHMKEITNPPISNEAIVESVARMEKARGAKGDNPLSMIDPDFDEARLYKTPHNCETFFSGDPVFESVDFTKEPQGPKKKTTTPAKTKSKTPATKTKGSARKPSGAVSTTPSKPNGVRKRGKAVEQRVVKPGEPRPRRSRRLQEDAAENAGLPMTKTPARQRIR